MPLSPPLTASLAQLSSLAVRSAPTPSALSVPLIWFSPRQDGVPVISALWSQEFAHLL